MSTTNDIISDLRPMPLLSISSSETISKCAAMQLEPSDIFICSYPKSGTTWTQHIVISLLLRHNKQIQKKRSGTNTLHDIEYNHVSDFAPFFEIDPHWKRTTPGQFIPDIQKRHEQLGRRVFNTHLRGNMLPTQMKNRNSGRPKIIYIVRNPLDACVSFYYHLSHQHQGCYESSLHQFFKDWIDGKIPFGTWAEHILSYAPLLAEKSVLFITTTMVFYFISLLYRSLMTEITHHKRPAAYGWLPSPSFMLSHDCLDLTSSVWCWC
jgi:hypothetical protein